MIWKHIDLSSLVSRFGTLAAGEERGARGTGGGGAEAVAHCLQEGKGGLRDGVALRHMHCGVHGCG